MVLRRRHRGEQEGPAKIHRVLSATCNLRIRLFGSEVRRVYFNKYYRWFPDTDTVRMGCPSQSFVCLEGFWIMRYCTHQGMSLLIGSLLTMSKVWPGWQRITRSETRKVTISFPGSSLHSVSWCHDVSSFPLLLL